MKVMPKHTTRRFQGRRRRPTASGEADDVVRALPGRLVAFTSGLENLHRVVPPEGGPRYVLAMWFGREPSGPATAGSSWAHVMSRA